MKIQIDTERKTLKIENSVKLDKLFKFLDKILPGEWKDYTIETNVTINWTSPIVYRDRPDWWDRWRTVYYYGSTGGSVPVSTTTVTTKQDVPFTLTNNTSTRGIAYLDNVTNTHLSNKASYVGHSSILNLEIAEEEI